MKINWNKNIFTMIVSVVAVCTTASTLEAQSQADDSDTLEYLEQGVLHENNDSETKPTVSLLVGASMRDVTSVGVLGENAEKRALLIDVIRSGYLDDAPIHLVDCPANLDADQLAGSPSGAPTPFDTNGAKCFAPDMAFVPLLVPLLIPALKFIGISVAAAVIFVVSARVADSAINWVTSSNPSCDIEGGRANAKAFKFCKRGTGASTMEQCLKREICSNLNKEDRDHHSSTNACGYMCANLSSTFTDGGYGIRVDFNCGQFFKCEAEI